MIIPNTHNEDHSVSHSLAHGGQTSLGGEVVGITESSFLVRAELICDRVVGCHSGDVDLGVLEDLTILNVQATDFTEGSGGAVVVGQELSDNCEFFGGVDCLPFSIEGGVTHAERVEIATVGIAKAVVSTINSAVLAAAAGLSGN